MNKIFTYARDHPALVSLLIFCGMIIPSLLLYTAAESGSQAAAAIFFALVILANLAALLPRGST